MAVSAAEEGKQSKQAEQEGDHRAGIFSGSAQLEQSLGAGRSFGEGQVRLGLYVKRLKARSADPAARTVAVEELRRAARIRRRLARAGWWN